MAKKDPARTVHWIDPAQEAADTLSAHISEATQLDDLVIVDEKLKERVKHEQKKGQLSQSPHLPETTTQTVVEEEGIAIGDARREEKLVTVTEEYEGARILFITKDTTVIEEKGATYKRLTDLRNYFSEVHILLLAEDSKDNDSVFRFFNNVWAYKTSSETWWKVPFDGLSMIEEQLVFGETFRADIIVAEDPLESGLVAVRAAKKYNVPVQLHVYDDYHDDEFLKSFAHPTVYGWVMKYVLKRITSLRTETGDQKESLTQYCEGIKDVGLLPNYYNLSAWEDSVINLDLHTRYPQFKFIVLHVSEMKNHSHSSEVMNGVSPLLRRYPTVGLVIVGNGPLRSKLEKQAITLGLQNQIEFEPTPKSILSHIKSANVLVHLSSDSAEDDVVLGGAVLKTPMVLNAKGIGGNLFVDNESSILCDPTDMKCVTNGVNKYLNDNHLRNQFALLAHDTVFEKIEQDYSGYLDAYANTIKHGLESET